MTAGGQPSLNRRHFLLGASGALGLPLLPMGHARADHADLHFYNWDAYIGESTLSDFEDHSGLTVHTDVYSENEELFLTLKGGRTTHDVIVPSSDIVQRMIADGMLAPLNHDLLANFGNLSPAFQNADFDPGRKYTIPYAWGALGIGYRKSKVPEPPDSWRWVLDSDRHGGRIALLDDARATLGAALKYLGHSLNAVASGPLDAAVSLLRRQKMHVKTFAAEEGQDMLLTGEADIVMEWSADINQVMSEDEDISFVIPREGSVIWQDTLAIPVSAPHPENAHQFIDYMLEAEVAAEIADFLQIATPNRAAREFLGPDYTQNPTLNAAQDTLAKCESILSGPGEQRASFDAAWKRVRA